MSRWPGEAWKSPTSFGGLSRSELMSRVRSKGNKTTELAAIEQMRAARLSGWHRHARLAGHPDFVWRKLKVALFVDGCFWHGHQDCARNLRPRTNAQAWLSKQRRNRERDQVVTKRLRAGGWSVIRVWECELGSGSRTWLRRLKAALSRRARR